MVYFARATQVWLPVNHNASITSANEFDVSKRIARASELGSCQSICVIHEAMNGCIKSKDSLKDCFENVNIHESNVGSDELKHLD